MVVIVDPKDKGRLADHRLPVGAAWTPSKIICAVRLAAMTLLQRADGGDTAPSTQLRLAPSAVGAVLAAQSGVDGG